MIPQFLKSWWKRNDQSVQEEPSSSATDAALPKADERDFNLHDRSDLILFLTKAIGEMEELSRTKHGCPDLRSRIPDLAECFADVIAAEGVDNIDDRKFRRIFEGLISSGEEALKGVQITSGNVRPENAVIVMLNYWAGHIANTVTNYQLTKT